MFLALVVSLAHAEDAAFVGAAKAATFEKPETHVTANVGGNFTAGNAESVSLNAGADATHKWKNNQFGAVAGAAIGFGAVDANADGFLSSAERCIGVAGRECSATAERYLLDLRYDRFITERGSLYLLGGGLHDKFAGYQLRTHVQLGYARQLLDTDKTRLRVEAGVDFANEDYVPGVVPASTELLAAQVAGNFSHQFNESVGFTDVVSVYEPLLTQPAGSPFSPHVTDLRVTNLATISAKMTDKLSISVSDTYTWRNEPVAAPDGITELRSNFDNTLSVALVASLL